MDHCKTGSVSADTYIRISMTSFLSPCIAGSIFLSCADWGALLYNFCWTRHWHFEYQPCCNTKQRPRICYSNFKVTSDFLHYCIIEFFHCFERGNCARWGLYFRSRASIDICSLWYFYCNQDCLYSSIVRFLIFIIKGKYLQSVTTNEAFSILTFLLKFPTCGLIFDEKVLLIFETTIWKCVLWGNLGFWLKSQIHYLLWEIKKIDNPVVLEDFIGDFPS